LPHGSRTGERKGSGASMRTVRTCRPRWSTTQSRIGNGAHAQRSLVGRCRMSLLQRLSFNQMTADPWSLEQVVRNCSSSGISYIGVWRHKLDGDTAKASEMIRSEGLRVSSLCRGGWFSAPTPGERRKRIADNRRAIEEAALLEAPVLVIV